MENPIRIAIFGKPGSGKSTFASELSKKLNAPLHHLDKIFFIENWADRNYQDFLADQQKIVSTDSWIIDGNSLQSLEIRYARANTVIYFNYPSWLCCWRMIKRFWRSNPDIQDLPPGCTKTISWKLLSYLWGYENRINPSLTALQERYPQIQFFEIRSDKELKQLTTTLFPN